MDKLYPDLRDVLITIVLLVLATGMFAALSWLAHYPDGKDWKFAIIVILAVAAIPILFRVLSFLQQTRSVLDIKGIKIDFGKTLTIPGVQLAENLVEKNQPVTDSGTQAVLEVAQQASKSAVVVVDLKDGDAWYKTRLFALTAPALEFGYPRIIVFLATQNASAAAFLGFADALAVSSSIMQDQNYKTAFSNAVAKYYQLAAFAKDELRPFNLALVPVVQGEAYDFRGRSSLMALLIHETMHLEPPMQPEPWVKALDLQHLLGDDLHTDKIEDRKRDPEVILRFCLEVPTILLSFAASLRRSCIGRARHARGAWNVGSPTLINHKRQIAPAMLHCAKMRLQRRRGHFVSTTARSEK